ncbi:conserved hypothetical protein [Luminiphilus syltensis NOR5-1B]|uniref:DUF1554 domain-containing protein n=1 Tax=Luminiphilus syltensis NOR5-1B TaxID=565045 RepID=B8KVS8_9GAMM|nr:conserved hypothetical protein [Luminiphilus syltensis NOR5-1B]
MSAIAQTTGTLTYGPSAGAGGSGATPAEPVPIPSLFLLPLAVALAFFGYRALRKQGGRQLLGAVLLASGVSLGGISSLHIQDAIAQMMIELNQPNGGTVDIPVSDAIYTNTSGVALQIGTVTAPPSCATSAPADECVTDLTLENGESCSTVYDCTQTISFTSTAPTDATAGGATYDVAATATSGLAVTFSTTSAACSVSGSTVTFDAVGDCVINADQAGDANFSVAPQVQQSFSVALPVVTVTKTADGAEGMMPTDASFTLTRTGDTTNPLTVTYALSGTATVVNDYTVASEATIEIPASHSSVDLPITVLDDEVYDPSETVEVTLSANTAYTVGTVGAVVAEITAPDKRLFVTRSGYVGGLGGIAGADAKCNADANKPSDGGTYKAMLAGGGRSAAPTPSDWVLAADTKYFRPSGVYIAGTGPYVVFSFPLVSAVDPGVGRVWTGLLNNWTAAGSTCDGWSGETLVDGFYGLASRLDILAISIGASSCSGAQYPLYCVEQ